MNNQKGKKIIEKAWQEVNKGNLLNAKKLCFSLLENNKNADIYNLLGIISFTEKKYLESLTYLKTCIRISKNHYKALNNIALLLIEIKKYKRAIHFLNLSLEINDRFIQAYINLSLAYIKLRDLNKSIYFLKKILNLEKNNIFALNNLGNIYYEKGNYKKSIITYNKALEESYENPLVHNNLGLLYERLHRFEKAKFHYQHAIKVNSDYNDCKFNLSLLLLKMGNYKEGFDLYVSRFFKLEKKIKLPCRVNMDLNLKKIKSLKKIFIIAEQGYGDIFQFCRFGLLFKKLKVISYFVVYDELYQFMKNQSIFDKYITVSDFLKLQNSEFTSFPLMSLPKLFKIETNNLMPSIQYLFPKKTKVNQWKKKISQKKFNIGIAWQSIIRGIPYKYFFKLLDIPNVNVTSLHIPSHLENKSKSINNKITFFDNLDIDNKFEDTAALIANLDLIITVDTSIAHLSASMGKNTWVLLHYNSDWRWMLKIKKSPWYDSVTLFRPRSYNNWDYVFNNVLIELKKLLD